MCPAALHNLSAVYPYWKKVCYHEIVGRLSRYFTDIPQEEWMAAVEKSVPAKFLELNRRAFQLGRGA